MNQIFSFTRLRIASVSVYDGTSLKNVKNRIVFVLLGLYGRGWIISKINERERNVLTEIFERDISYLGFIVWPYINRVYDAPSRFRLVAAHDLAVREYFPNLNLSRKERLKFVSLSHLYKGLDVSLEDAPWFIREGRLNFSLMLSEIRLMTISFSLDFCDHNSVAYIGAIQGSATTTQENYREIANCCCDLRPRDFTFKIFRLFLFLLGVTSLRCIADSNRVMHHKFFGKEKADSVAMQYDDLWRDQGGILASDGYFDMLSFAADRPLSEVPMKKRGRYRRRLEMLDSIKEEIQTALNHHGIRTLARPDLTSLKC